MDDLNALFDSVDGLKEDLIEYGTIAAGAVGANIAWNYLTARFVPPTLSPVLQRYGIPALAIVGGIFAGRAVARRDRRIGLGVTIGLVSAGLSAVVRELIPAMSQPSVSGFGAQPYGMMGAAAPARSSGPMMVEDFHGAPTTIEFSGAPVIAEDFAGLGGFHPGILTAQA
jgi:hypothetical protein